MTATSVVTAGIVAAATAIAEVVIATAQGVVRIVRKRGAVSSARLAGIAPRVSRVPKARMAVRVIAWARARTSTSNVAINNRHGLRANRVKRVNRVSAVRTNRRVSRVLRCRKGRKANAVAAAAAAVAIVARVKVARKTRASNAQPKQ